MIPYERIWALIAERDAANQWHRDRADLFEENKRLENELARVRASRERLRAALEDSIVNDDACCNDLVNALPEEDRKPL
jgi:hypothetical protein